MKELKVFLSNAVKEALETAPTPSVSPDVDDTTKVN